MNLENIKNQPTKSAYTISGDMFFLQDVQNIFMQKENINTEDVVIIADAFDVQSYTSQAMQFSFFSGKKLLVVKNIKSISLQDKQALKKVVADQNQTNITLFVDTENNKVWDFLGLENISLQQTPQEIKAFIQKTAQQNNFVFENDALFFLVKNAKNMFTLNSELNKLFAIKCADKTITLEDVCQNTTENIEGVVFTLLDHLAKKDANSAFLLLKNLLLQSEDQNKIFAYLSSSFKRMFFVAASAETNAQIAKNFGIKEFAVAKLKEKAKMFKISHLMQISRMFNNLEFDYKSGKMTLSNCLHFAINQICMK